MITMLGSRRRFCDGLTRRETLKAGALGLAGGFHLPGLLRAEEARGAQAAPGKESAAYDNARKLLGEVEVLRPDLKSELERWGKVVKDKNIKQGS